MPAKKSKTTKKPKTTKKSSAKKVKKAQKKKGGKSKKAGDVPVGDKVAPPRRIPEAKRVQQEMDRLMGDITSGFDKIFPPRPLEHYRSLMSQFPMQTIEGYRTPYTDLKVRDKEMVFSAEMPGVTREDIKIEVTKMGIKVSAQKTLEITRDDEHYHHRERSQSSFYRYLTLPEEVIAEKADANFENGVLEVVIPKKVATKKGKAVKVKVK